MQNANSASAKPTRIARNTGSGFGAAVSGLDESKLDLAEILRRFRQPLADTFQERDDLIGRRVCVLRLRLAAKHVTQPVVDAWPSLRRQRVAHRRDQQRAECKREQWKPERHATPRS